MKNKIYFFILLNMSSITISNDNKKYNIGLCIMATGKYIDLANNLIESGQKYFCKNHNVTYFVFTDREPLKYDNVLKIDQKKLGWPYDTMMRFEIYYKQKNLLSKMDYIFSIDADSRFDDLINDEILGELVATEHPDYVGTKGTYETNPISLAYIDAKKEGEKYFVGAFWGGSSKEFLKACKIISKKIKIDLANKHMPIWHDESHLNRYFIDHKPTLILSPSYCYHEYWHTSKYAKKIIAVNKNHFQMRAD